MMSLGGTFLKTPIERDYYSDDICSNVHDNRTRYLESTRDLRNCLLTYNNITLNARDNCGMGRERKLSHSVVVN